MKQELVYIFLCAILSLACLNDYVVDEEGIKEEVGNSKISKFITSFQKAKLEYKLSKYDLGNLEKYNYKKQSDLSIILIKLGRFEEALKILKPLTEKYPEEYTLMANIGTVYELLGNVEQALFFIKKGLELNPESHEGSEWIHVKILEAKINLQKNPNWLNTHSIIGNDKLNQPKAKDKYSQEHGDRIILINQIDYQLRTRIPFTPTPDLITAKLFQELADLAAREFSVEYAYIYYKITSYFAEGKNNDIKNNIIKYKKLVTKHYRQVPNIDEYFPTKNFTRENNRVNLNAKPYTPKKNISSLSFFKQNKYFLLVGVIAVFVLLLFIITRLRKRNT